MLTILIDDSRRDGDGALLFQAPQAIVRADQSSEIAAALAALEAGLAAGLHAAGFLAYDLGLLLEPKLVSLLPMERHEPLLLFGLYAAPRRLTNPQADAWLAEQAGPDTASLSAPPEPNWSAAEYLERFEAAKSAIAAGDIYQLNLTLEARFRLTGPPCDFYRRLRQRQRVAYGAVIQWDGGTILSLSPELFLDIDGRAVRTRPMKGTAARALTEAADVEVRRALASDAKSRAENLMIVDLMRNDIGRIAEIGSVRVPDLFTVETLKTLHQMTSGVEAQLLPGIGLTDIVKATFPAGSITGAPKIRAMEIIAALEQRSRGVYCGSIGWLDPGGRGRFNVAIRTLAIAPDGAGRIGIGSGVVADSDGAAEYAECLLKMRFLTAQDEPFGLFETLRLDADLGYTLLERHLDRLRSSARYFDMSYDEPAVRQALAEAKSAAGPGSWRIRFDLAADGTITIQQGSVPTARVPFNFIIAEDALDPTDVFLYHKTTRRQRYDQARAGLAQHPDIDEIVYLNAADAVCEGTITNIFVARNGMLLTPPLSAGLLPGTLRAELLATGRAVEAELKRADLETGEVWLGNALRGLMPARLVGRRAV